MTSQWEARKHTVIRVEQTRLQYSTAHHRLDDLTDLMRLVTVEDNASVLRDCTVKRVGLRVSNKTKGAVLAKAGQDIIK